MSRWDRSAEDDVDGGSASHPAELYMTTLINAILPSHRAARARAAKVNQGRKAGADSCQGQREYRGHSGLAIVDTRCEDRNGDGDEGTEAPNAFRVSGLWLSDARFHPLSTKETRRHGPCLGLN